jgi:hypothetical protein
MAGKVENDIQLAMRQKGQKRRRKRKIRVVWEYIPEKNAEELFREAIRAILNDQNSDTRRRKNLQ